MIAIKKYNSPVVRAIIEPDNKSQQSGGLMKDDIVSLSFTTAEYIPFQIGDYATIFGSLYKLNRDVKHSKTGNRRFDWSFTMEGLQYDLTRSQYLALDASNHFTEGKFSVRLKPRGFCELIISNLKRTFPNSNWRLGSVIDGDFKTIDFSGENCLQALIKIAGEYKTEYFFEGDKINLFQKQTNTQIVLDYGKGKALYSCGKEPQNNYSGIVTRLYAYGSSKNLGSNYRNGAQSLRMADSLFIEKNIDKYGPYEQTIYFDGSNGLPEIYPHRTGKISSVISNTTFTDSSINFNPFDYKITGAEPKIVFNTGALAGIAFEIASFETVTKGFVIRTNNSSQTLPMPSDSFKPAIGDEYVLVDITMPPSYYKEAEDTLLAAAKDYLASNGPAKLNYPIICNPLFFKARGIVLTPGLLYNFKADYAGIDLMLRLISFTRNLRNPDLYTCDLSDRAPEQNLLVTLINNL